jgi:hypothetical protein
VDERKLITSKFKALGHDKISDFVRDVKSELTQETWGAVLNRGSKPELKTLLKMAADLNFTTAELNSILLARGEKQIAAWISPTSLTAEEQKIIEKFRAMNGDIKKTRLIADLLDLCAGGGGVNNGKRSQNVALR